MPENTFKDELKAIFDDRAAFEKEEVGKYSFDKSPLWLFKKDEKNVGLGVVKPSRDRYQKELADLINLAKKYGKKIVIRGGGSGVLGAATPRIGNETVIIDMTDLDFFRINGEKTWVETGAGIIGSRLENSLNEIRRTLGHSPASLGISTPGGWVASRSSGQFSSNYGTIEDLVLSLEIVDAFGKISDIQENELQSFFRMEGTTGIITKVRMKIFPIDKNLFFRSYSFLTLNQSLEALRILFEARKTMEKEGVFLKAVRLYDFIDRFLVAKPHSPDKKEKNKSSLKRFLEKIILRYPDFLNRLAKDLEKIGLARPILIFVVSSLKKEKAEEWLNHLDNLFPPAGKKRKNDSIAKVWHENRFKLRYEKLEEKIKDGFVIDAFDCQPRDHKEIFKIYEAVKNAVKKYAIIGAHFGLDRKNYYIYFTFIGRGGLELYKKIWMRILAAAYKNRGYTAHHHGIGFLKAGKDNLSVKHAYGIKWLEEAEKRKRHLDPENIFNPGNIFNK
ncbi:MAG: FAD-binding oxidoreductase [Patescibacteria group bacterium]